VVYIIAGRPALLRIRPAQVKGASGWLDPGDERRDDIDNMLLARELVVFL
jgi:hypothetical protein